MTAYYSDNVSGSGANTTLDTQYRASVGIRHGRVRTSIARATTSDSTGFQTTDVVRMITLKSSDRLLALAFAADGTTGNAAEVDIGVYLTGTAHDGAVDDANLFADAADCATESDLDDIFDNHTLCDGVDRGRTMWELVTLGGGTNYTEDPNIEFDICLTPGTSFDNDTECVLKATYTSGD